MAVTQNTYTGDGTTVLFSFTFPYLETTDIKVSLDGSITTAYTLANATTIQFNTAPTNGAAIRIYRETDDSALAATFYPGSAIRSNDLNDNFTQNLYVTQESTNNAATANTTANTALTNSNTAISTANSAVSTANTASSNASAAVATANTASSNASAAVSTANTASTNATTAVNTANAATATANSAVSDAATAISTANSAVSTANTASTNATNAVNTANAASSTASSAVSTANTASTNASNAVSTANSAVTTANNAVSTANSAVSTANSAVSTANAAASAVANAILYDIVANVAAIPGSPANNDAVEVTDSTGIESFTPLTGVPGGFVGNSGLSVRIVYTTTGNTWTWIQYFPNDPETRYLKLGGGTLTGSLGVTTGSAASPSVFVSGDTNTGIYSPGADQLALSTNGTGRVFVDASGRVGIGTTPSLGFNANEDDLIVGDGAGSRGITIYSSSTDNGGLLFADGTTGTDRYVGGLLYRHGDNSLTISTAAVERLRITSAGLVGVGTSVPDRKLTIFNDSDAVMRLGRTDAISHGSTDVELKFSKDYYSNAVFEAASHRFEIQGTERFRIDSSGRVGIGTSAPSSMLTVGPQYDRLNVDPGSGSYDGDPTSVVIDGRTNNGSATAFKIDRYDGAGSASTKFLINYAGQVGIGTTSPNQDLTISSGADKLHLFGSSAGNGGSLFATNSGYTDYEPISFTGEHIGFSTRTGALTSSERARITSNGQLLVGTSSARSLAGNTGQLQLEGTSYQVASITTNSNDNLGAYLILSKSRGTSLGSNTVVQNSDTLGGIFFNGSDGSASLYGASVLARVDGTPGNNDLPTRLEFSVTQDGSASPTARVRIDNEGIFTHNSSNHGIATFVTASAGTAKYVYRGHYGATAGNFGSGTISFTVWSNGNVENTNNSYGAISDLKLKENIVDANSQWDDIKALQVRKYNFKEGQTHTQIGLVAQEVELVSPGLVTESPDRDAEGNDLGTVTKSVNYSVLYMKAVKALQEAMERIETLEAKVASLESA